MTWIDWQGIVNADNMRCCIVQCKFFFSFWLNKLSFQSKVLWGGRWQEDSACTTGEEVEQINAHMSRCGNTTEYMLPEGDYHSCSNSVLHGLEEAIDF